jgi:membrane complex biogenesis BtpA family protein
MRDLFSSSQALVGMVHVQALPGTPSNTLTPDEIVRRAVEEAEILERAGYDGVILENMHDLPYLNRSVGPEIVASMACVCQAVRRAIDLPMGVQILAGANEAALSVAYTGGADFIRAEGFVFAHTADEGLMQACAGDLLRFRKRIGAERVRVLCDIKKKHCSHALTQDLDLTETVRAAKFFMADGVIVTGVSTGCETDVHDLKEVAEASDLPVWIGSGLTPDNVGLYQKAHGLIVGSWIKEDGDWRAPVDPVRAHRMVEAFRT